MNFSKNVTLTLISNAIYVVLGLTFSILVARNFGPEGKGIVSLMSVISTTTLQFANLGLAGALTYFVARRMGEAKNFAASSIVFGLLWGSFVAFLIYLIHLSHPILFGAIPDKFVYIALISIPIILIGNFLNNILLGQEKIFAFNLVQVIGQLILVALGVVLIFGAKADIFPISLVSMIIVPIVVILGYAFFIFKDAGNVKVNMSLLKEPLRYGRRFFVALLLSFLILKSDTLLVNFFLNIREVGFYSIASGFADYLSLAPILIGTILFPRAIKLGKEAIGLVGRVSRVTFLLMIILSLSAVALAQPIIVLLYGRNFTPAVAPFLFLVPGMFFWSLSIIYNNYFASQNLLNVPIISGSIGFVVNLSLNIIYIPRFGIDAAAISSSLAYFIVFMINNLYLIRMTNLKSRELLVLKREDIKALLGAF